MEKGNSTVHHEGLALKAALQGANEDKDFLKMVSDKFEALIRRIKDLFNGSKSVGKGAVNLFRSPPGEYITFILFIIFIFVGVAWLAFSPNSPFRRAGKGGGGGGGGGGGVWQGVTNYFEKINVDTSWLNKFRGKNGDAIRSIPRKTIIASEGGRCDGVNNIDVANATSKICLNAKMPVTIEWDIDPTQHSGWTSLPRRVQEKLIQEKGGRRVYIPWGIMESPADAANPFAKLKKEANTLVPLCSKAYYGDGSSAAHLFQSDDETQGSCKRAVLPNRVFTRTTRRYEDTRPETKTAVNRGENKTCTL